MSGSDLRTWREQRGLTQRQLAAVLDLGKRTIERYEQAARVPRVVELALSCLPDPPA